MYVNLETAVKYPRPVKVVTNNSKAYKFLRLEQYDDQVFGISKKNSRTSKMLYNQIVEDSLEMPFDKILLAEEDINKIFNRKSTDTDDVLLTAATIGAIAAVIVLIVSVIGFTQGWY